MFLEYIKEEITGQSVEVRVVPSVY